MIVCAHRTAQHTLKRFSSLRPVTLKPILQSGSRAFRWLGVLVIKSSRSPPPPGQASRAAYHHLISSLGKIQKHSYSATMNFWLVRFWQMFLLAENYFSCLSFCLSSHPQSSGGITLGGNPVHFQTAPSTFPDASPKAAVTGGPSPA